ALSGSEQNPDLTGKDVKLLLSRVRSGAPGPGISTGAVPRVRALGWAYALLVASLCGEWVVRRRMGLR
ncbi:MAG TPA: hypothetical protein VJU87_08885, partial [Gemmatimonadaceae bacterium]|nr:hypothetical protein [Gemmatimonadaceae bacterium]